MPFPFLASSFVFHPLLLREKVAVQQVTATLQSAKITHRKGVKQKTAGSILRV